MFFLYANQVINHISIINISKILKKYPKTPLIVIENTQAVTAYSFKKVSKGILILVVIIYLQEKMN